MQGYFHFSAFPLLSLWMKGDYKMQKPILISLVVTNRIKIVLLSVKQRLHHAEPVTESVVKSDMTKII